MRRFVMARKSSNLVVLAAWVLSFCLVIQPLPAPAQVLYGSIAGTLTDPSGAALPNTHVTVTNPLTGLKRERSEEHTSELQSQSNLVCRLLLEKKKNNQQY